MRRNDAADSHHSETLGEKSVLNCHHVSQRPFSAVGSNLEQARPSSSAQYMSVMTSMFARLAHCSTICSGALVWSKNAAINATSKLPMACGRSYALA